MDLARHYRPLYTFSCFEFESFNFFIKKLVHSAHFTIQQAIKRVLESDQFLGSKPQLQSCIQYKCLSVHSYGPVCACHCGEPQYCCLKSDVTLFSIHAPNNIFLSKSNKLCQIYNIINSTPMPVFVYKQFLQTSDAFTYPLLSSHLDIYKATKQLSQMYTCKPLSQVKCKMMLLPFKECFYATPVLHTYKQ